jgi:streptogramin lyase
MRIRHLALIALILVSGGCQHRSLIASANLPEMPGGPVIPLIRQNPGFLTRWLLLRVGSAGYGDTIVGPDGAIWSDDFQYGKMARIDYLGHVRTLSLLHNPNLAMASGPDGNIWFPSSTSTENFIVRMTPQGSETTFPISIGSGEGITVAQDGNMWFTEVNVGAPGGIGRITMNGTVTEFPVAHSPGEIASGPDGDLYYTSENSAGFFSVYRITPTGQITEHQILGQSFLDPMTTGPDGKAYFLDIGNPVYDSYLGTISSGFNVTEERIPAPNGFYPITLGVGPDGNIWIGGGVFRDHNRVGFLVYDRTSGHFSAQPITAPGAQWRISYNGIVTGLDGNVWWHDGFEDVLVYHLLQPSPTSFTFTGVGQQQTLTIAETHSSGPWSVSSTNVNIATVRPGTTSDTFIVTSVAAGHARILIDDKHLNIEYLPVTVQ